MAKTKLVSVFKMAKINDFLLFIPPFSPSLSRTFWLADFKDKWYKMVCLQEKNK